MKRQIKLTESEFKNVIKECVKNIIYERNRFEHGMSDTEIKRRRLDNFMKDVDTPKNIFDKHFPEPCVSDYAAEPECGWNDYFDNQRIRQHRSRQNKNKNLDESLNTDDLRYQIDGENIIFMNNKGEEVGGMCFNCTNFDGIYSEYNDSVEDFDSHIMSKFKVNATPIVNIEDIWVNKKFQCQGLFRKELSIGLNLLTQKYNQFILRACSDNDFPEDKLVEIYQDYGFVPYQETDEDGTIMYLTMNNYISESTSMGNNQNDINLNMPVIIVGGKLNGEYTINDVINNFEVTGYVEPFRNSAYKNSKIVGYPRIRGYHGPMWDGNRIRYESPEAYDSLSI